MSDDLIEAIYSEDQKRRVVIFRRASGTYGYREEYNYRNELAQEEGWASVGGHPCYYESLEIAKREVAENVIWLAKR